MYYTKFKDKSWAGFSKNRTKRNYGRIAPTGIPRRRVAQALPPNSKKDNLGLLFVSAKENVNAEGQEQNNDRDNGDVLVLDSKALFMDETSVKMRMMHHALDVLVKGSFGSTSRAKGWSSNHTQLVPPVRTLDNSTAWEALLDQCQCIGLLAQLGLYHCVNFSLPKIFHDFDRVSQHSAPTLLIYFWKICSSIFNVRLRGRALVLGDDPLYGQSFALMRMFLKHMRESFFLRLGKGHPIVHLLDALTCVIKSSPVQFKHMLGIGYSTAINALGRMIGADHPVVLTMSSHCAKQHWTTDIKLREEIVQMRYELSFVQAEQIYGTHSENTISLLYNYVYAMAKGYDDSDLVFKLASQLRDRTETFCRNQTKLQCSIFVRAFVFSTGLLAKNYQWQDPSLTRRQLDKAIEILRHGDQECRIYALSLSKLLEAKLRGRDNVNAMTEEKKRAEALQSNIYGIKPSDFIEIAGGSNDSPSEDRQNKRSQQKRESDELYSWLAIRVKENTNEFLEGN